MIPLQDTLRGGNPPLGVCALIGLNVLIFTLERSLPQSTSNGSSTYWARAGAAKD